MVKWEYKMFHLFIESVKLDEMYIIANLIVWTCMYRFIDNYYVLSEQNNDGVWHLHLLRNVDINI